MSETRMLERRVSNNRADLSGDAQMNYFFSWFTQWSELQKSDFVPVLAAKMSKSVNGTTEELGNLAINEEEEEEAGNNKKPPSLFSCQVKLFRDWFGNWSEEQHNYLLLRLQDIDAEFYAKYLEFAEHGDSAFVANKVKDYFEPGVPAHLVRTSRKDSTNSSPNVSLEAVRENGHDEEQEEEQEEEQDDDDDDDCLSAGDGKPLDTITE